MVALKPAEIERFLAAPDAPPHEGVDAVLVYGPDRGLVAERARTLLGHFAADPHDPFAVSFLDDAELARQPERLAEELTAIAFGGGRRTVFVRVAGGAPPDALVGVLDAPREAALIVEAGELRAGTPLRKAFEAAKDAVALPCYADNDRSLAGLIDDVVAGFGQTIDAPARGALTERLGADRLSSRSEVEKVALHAGPGARITIDDVAAIASDAAATTLDAMVDAMGEGHVARLETAWRKALEGGASPGRMATVALGHVQRLHRIAASGRPVDKSTLARERPPVFWARQPSWLAQLRRWREPQLRRALDILGDAERSSRLDSAMAESLVARALIRVALLPR